MFATASHLAPPGAARYIPGAMPRLPALLLALFGLLAAMLHVPSMAAPAMPGPAPAAHADCHEALPSDETPPAEPGCCPGNCSVGCLPVVALASAPTLDARAAGRASLTARIPAAGPPAPSVVPFHPPRPAA